MTLPQVATVTAPAGSFRGQGTITITPVRVPLPYGGSLSAAGTGIDVTYSGVTLSRPLTITFDTTARPARHDVPVVAHRLANGTWTLALATVTAGRMSVQARTFSPHIPAWLNPGAWMHWLGDRLASLAGGRTPPITCAGGGPAWASVSKQTDEAHTCLIPNVDRASHAVRAEVQIKSNRGVALEVDIPPGADYTWVQDQSWAARSWVWGHIIHQDPSLMALLPAGATLTAGYRQPAANENLAFQVQVSYWSLAYSLIGDIVDALSGSTADKTGLATLYLLSKCSGAVGYSSLSLHNPLSTATLGSAMSCVISEALSDLSSPEKALGAARSLLGPGVYQMDLDTATKELTSVGGKLLTFGWVVTVWPVLQLGWGGTADVVHNLLTGGASALISLHLRGAPAVTQKVYVSAVGSQGSIAPGLQVTQTEGGANCGPGSEAIGNAYRCFAGNGVYDPCWPDRHATSPTVLCLETPWSHDVIKLILASSLPPLTGSSGTPPPWGLQLTDGRNCVLEQGAHDSFDGRPVDYFCGGQEVVLRGLETAGTQWRAQTAIYSGGQYTMGPADGITIAWYGLPAGS